MFQHRTEFRTAGYQVFVEYKYFISTIFKHMSLQHDNRRKQLINNTEILLKHVLLVL